MRLFCAETDMDMNMMYVYADDLVYFCAIPTAVAQDKSGLTT